MSSRLRELQENFQAYLLGESAIFEQAVATDARRNLTKKRLAIYHEAYYLRLVEVLQSDFPGLYRWLGAKKFTQLGKNYLKDYPSKFFSARLFGHALSQFLATHQPYAKQGFLSQLAAFEWALSSAIDAPNAPILTLQDLATIPADAWSNLVFEFHPSVRFFKLDWDLPSFRRTLLAKGRSLAPKALAVPENWLVWRKELTPHYAQLSDVEAKITSALAAGKNFTETCEVLSDLLPDAQAAEAMVQTLRRLLLDGIISAIR